MTAPESTASAAKSRRQEIALVALFCLLPLFAGGGGLGLAPLMALCGLASLPPHLQRRGLALPALVLLTAIWVALSIFWSPGPRPEQPLKIVGVVVTGLSLVFAASSLPQRPRASVRIAVIASVLALAFFLSVEAMFDMPLNRLFQPAATTELLQRNPGRGVLVLEALGFAALGGIMHLGAALRIGLGAALLLAMGALSVQFDMEANALAFLCGLAAFVVGFFAPRLGPTVVGSALAVWMLSAPWVMLALSRTAESFALQLPPSWGMRLQIWTYAAQQISQRPLFGWGLDSSRTFDEPLMLNGIVYNAIPLHPHSVSLQVWLETGAIGASLSACVLTGTGFLAARAFSEDRVAGAIAAASMMVLGVTWNLSYGAWQEWFMALPFIVAAAALALRREGRAA